MKATHLLVAVMVSLSVVALLPSAAAADQIEVVLQPGETFQTDLIIPRGGEVADPNFWVHFHTQAHVRIRQHVWAWSHWKTLILSWWHFHAYYVIPTGVCVEGTNDGDPCTSDLDCTGGGICTSGAGVDITNIGTSSAKFNARKNTACVGGVNVGLECMADVDCPGSFCAVPVCRGGVNEGLVCTSNADCSGGDCDTNDVDLAVGQTFNVPITGPLDASLPPGCPSCPPRIARFWLWVTQIDLIQSWFSVHAWTFTHFHFAIDEWWHMDTEGLTAGGDSETPAYSIEITNKGGSEVRFTCDSNMLFSTVPAMSHWGLVLMLGLLSLFGLVVIRRTRVATD